MYKEIGYAIVILAAVVWSVAWSPVVFVIETVDAVKAWRKNQ